MPPRQTGSADLTVAVTGEIGQAVVTALERSREVGRAVNLEGSRNVFEAARSAGLQRLVYASSVAAYGFHRDNPQPLAVDAIAEIVGRLGFLPAEAQWVSAFREPVIMSTAKARRELR